MACEQSSITKEGLMADDMNPCHCGHVPEEHSNDDMGPCTGTYMFQGKNITCDCLMYEEDKDFGKGEW